MLRGVACAKKQQNKILERVEKRKTNGKSREVRLLVLVRGSER